MILVAYASKYGSTREVAEFIAATLRDEGHDVELQPAADIRSVDGHDAVVLGAGIYMGRLHAGARHFLKRLHGTLDMPFAAFAMGPDSLDEEKVADGRKRLEGALARYPDVRPVALAIFGGVVDPAKFRFPLNRMPASDARDWEAIRAWALELSPLLRGAGVGTARHTTVTRRST